MSLPDHLPVVPDMLDTHVIDNHTHLYSMLEYSGLGIQDSLDAAAAAGVIGVVEVGCDVPSSRLAAELAGRDPRVRAAVALHPNDAGRVFQRGGLAALDDELAQLPALAAMPGVVAVGETGLDYYRTRHPEAQGAQAHSFRAHIELARSTGKTLVIHDRDAHADILKILDAAERPERVVMHCFSGAVDFARECVDRGFWLSFPGVVTFGSAGPLREAAKATPLERMLVETDAPYLTPRPHRGKPNAPYLLPHTVTFLADLLEVPLDEFCRQVRANTEAAYTTRWGDGA